MREHVALEVSGYIQTIRTNIDFAERELENERGAE
jgi:hypothetical protein